MTTIIAGDDNNNQLYGSSNDELLLGRGGNDVLMGFGGNDTLVGGAGDDVLEGGDGRNRYEFDRGDGHDRIRELHPGHDAGGVLQFGETVRASDILVQRQGDDLRLTIKDSGDSVLVEMYFLQWSSSDSPYVLRPHALSDIRFADGMTWDANAVRAQLAPPLQLGDGDNVMGGQSSVDGGGGNDLLFGTGGADYLLGGAGDDRLEGAGGNDVMDGGTGNDVLVTGPGFGQASLRFVRGWGQDRVLTQGGSSQVTELRIEGVLPGALVASRPGDGADLLLSLKGSLDTITVEGYFGAGQPAVRLNVVFDNGTVWAASDLLDALYRPAGLDLNGTPGNDWLSGAQERDLLQGGAGDDYLYGNGGDDVLLGGTGEDFLYGGDGDDTLDPGAGNGLVDTGAGSNLVLFGRTAGTVVFQNNFSSHDTLRLADDVRPADVRLERLNDLSFRAVITGTPAAAVFQVTPDFGSPTAPFQLRFSFADGTAWDSAYLLRLLNTGDAGDNTMAGSFLNDTLYGLGGNDVLRGMGGDDTLYGGAGNDVLEGGDGANLLAGGAGNDLLVGGPGRDVYQFAPGDGSDRLLDWGYQGSLIRFGAGIAPASLRFTPDGPNMLLRYGTGDEIVIEGGADRTRQVIEGVEFADGSFYSWARLNPAPPVLRAPLPDMTAREFDQFSQTLSSIAFSDPEGQPLRLAVTLASGAALPGWLNFDAAAGRLSGKPGASDSGVLALKVVATDPDGLSAADFVNLTVLNTNQAPLPTRPIAPLHATEMQAFKVVLPADAFIDPDGQALRYLVEGDSANPLPAWLRFDAASRTLSGTPGEFDTGVVALRLRAIDPEGAYNSIGFGLIVDNINQAPVLALPLPAQTVEDGVNFTLALPSNMFMDPDVSDSGAFSVTGLPAWLRFDPVFRTLNGTATLADAGTTRPTVTWTDSGGLSASSDVGLTVVPAASVALTGTEGRDTLTGRSNADTLDGRGGDDVLDGGLGADLMRGGAGNDRYFVDQAGDSVVENAGEGSDSVTAAISYVLPANVETLNLAGGAALHGTGNALNNGLIGNSGDNVLDGAGGFDRLDGGLGNDTYVTDGNDTLVEAPRAGIDRVLSSVTYALAPNLEALSLTGAGLATASGNELNNLLQGNSAVNTLLGQDGLDLLQGGAGNDILSDSSSVGGLFDGGQGDDRLSGGNGRELFIGGGGADSITTGNGADILAFNRGDGQDTVIPSAGPDNILSLGHIGYADLSLRKAGSDLILATGGADQITFKSWYAGAQTVGLLQMVIVGGADYQPGGGKAIGDNKVELFNFQALVAQFTASKAGWSVASALASVSVGGSDTAAYGGDLAYAYATDGNLSTVEMSTALAIIGSPTFGSAQLLGGAVTDGSPMLY